MRLIPLFVVLALPALVACDPGDSMDLPAARRLYTDTDSMGTTVRARTIPVHARPELVENSGLVMSARQPGVLFIINDSGNEPMLFGLDTTGADRGAWRLQGATNVDWEAISIGPCDGSARADAVKSHDSCLYIGDVGDNDGDRKRLTIYRVHEPAADTVSSTSVISAESLSFTYEDRPHDVEAMYVAPDGSVNLITKGPLRTLRRRRRPSLIFTIPASAWRQRSPIARLIDSIAIVPGSAPNRVITDASLSRDGRLLAVRTYWQVYFFGTDSITGRVTDFHPHAVCNVAGLGERQGEGISWYLDGRQLVLSSEGRSEPLRIIDCQPRR